VVLVSSDGVPPDWTGANCLGKKPDGFFPERGTAQITARDAKRVCNGENHGESVCPLRGQCLEYALDSKERFGIWGGRSERERARIAKTRRVAAKRHELEIEQDQRRRELQIEQNRRRRSEAAKRAWENRRRAAVQPTEHGMTGRKVVAIGSRGASGKNTIRARSA
jgi:WhiB family redox-sensing transcriptional regulator